MTYLYSDNNKGTVETIFLIRISKPYGVCVTNNVLIHDILVYAAISEDSDPPPRLFPLCAAPQTIAGLYPHLKACIISI